MSKFIRLSGTLREGGALDNNYKIFLLLGLDSSSKILSGMWMGYIRNINVIHPFLFDTEASTLMYGGEEHGKEQTNLGNQAIALGSMFTLSGADEGKPYEATYQIAAIHKYDDDSQVSEERSLIGPNEA